MDHLGGIVFEIINYSQDVATAFLAVCLLTLMTVSARLPASIDSGPGLFYLRVVGFLTRTATFSLIYAALAVAARVVLFSGYGGPDGARGMDRDAMEAGAALKYLLIFCLAAGMLFFRSRLSIRIKALRSGN